MFAAAPLGRPPTVRTMLPLGGEIVLLSLAVPPGPEQVIVNVDVPLTRKSSPPLAVPTVFGVALHAFESPPPGLCVPLHAVASVELQLSVTATPEPLAASVTVGGGVGGVTVTVLLSLVVPSGPVQVMVNAVVASTRKSSPPFAVPTAFVDVLHAFESLPFGLCIPVHVVAFCEVQLKVSVSGLVPEMLEIASTTVGAARGTMFTTAVPVLSPLAAVTVTVPSDLAVTSPEALTVAIASSEDVQLTVRPASTVPLSSRSETLSCCVVPTDTVDVSGVTAIVATGTGASVTTAVPDFPSLEAVIVAVPTATAVTSPDALTVARVASDVDQLNVRPVSAVPAASASAALNCCVAPTTTVGAAGVTVIDATGTGATVTTAVPGLPSLVAEIVAVPAAIAVTSPEPLTVARDASDVDQIVVRPVSVPPPASSRAAISCCVAPTATVGAAGVTVIDATGTGASVTTAVPDFPSLVAVIVAVPTAAAVTNPEALTVALVASDDAQLIVRPGSTVPPTSKSVALSCCVVPTITVGAEGVTVTEATGTGTIVTTAVPVFPSLLAVIVEVPTATAVTSPDALTVARAASDVAQAIARPVSVAPPTSSGAALSCWVAPTMTTGAAGLTVTDATGKGRIVTTAAPVFPSLLAVIVDVPTETAVTSPDALTVARAASDVVQAIERPVSGAPPASRSAALSCWVDPTITIGAAGVTVTDATGTGRIVTTAVPVFPSLLAVIVDVPTESAVTSPDGLTVARVASDAAHTTARPGSTLPF